MIGIDSSQAQLEQARQAPNLTYRRASAEATGLLAAMSLILPDHRGELVAWYLLLAIGYLSPLPPAAAFARKLVQTLPPKSGTPTI